MTDLVRSDIKRQIMKSKVRLLACLFLSIKSNYLDHTSVPSVSSGSSD